MVRDLEQVARAPLVDTHAHLNFEDYEGELDAVVERAREAGLVGIVTVGIEPSDWGPTLEISSRYAGVFPALGIHPNSANQATTEAFQRLEELCRRPGHRRVVAVGETGLDFYREHTEHEVQREAFRAHLDLARQLDLPVIVHNRDAHADVLDILRRDGRGTRGVMHSFTGDLEFANASIELGYLVSLAGPVTFKKAADKHLIARSIPLDYLLVETDCPFLTPEPYRGRRNEPAYVQFTARAVAQLRGQDFDDVARATTANAVRLFGLGLPPTNRESEGAG